MDHEVTKLPSVIWNYPQPIADKMEEAISGVKGELLANLNITLDCEKASPFGLNATDVQDAV